MAFSFDDVEKAWIRFRDRELWTDIKPAILGNGETPPTVIIPPAQRMDDVRVFWAYQEREENKSVFAVANTYPGLPFNNKIAGLHVEVGYPPKSKILSIYSVDLVKLAEITGSALPIQIAVEQMRMVTPDRIQQLKLEWSGTGMVARILPGFWRSNNVIITVPEIIPVDLTAYVPSTSGKQRWVLVSLDDTGSVTLTAGEEFDVGTTTVTSTQVPISVPDGEQAIAWVRLLNGVTTLDNARIIHVHDMPIVGGASSELTSFYVNSYGGFMRTADGGFLRGVG